MFRTIAFHSIVIVYFALCPQQVTSDFSTLVLDSNGFNRDERLIFVEEDHGANSSFVLVSFVWRAIVMEGKRVLILSYHNSLEHYKFLVSKVGQVQDNQLRFLNGIDLFGMNSVETFERIRKFCISEQIDYLVLDDLSYHYHLHGLSDTVKFSRNLMSFLNEVDNFKIVIGLHTTDSNNELMALGRMFYHLSNFVISVHPLRSGFSAEVTGHLKVRTKAQLINKINTYSFKLDDKHFVLNPIVV